MAIENPFFQGMLDVMTKEARHIFPMKGKHTAKKSDKKDEHAGKRKLPPWMKHGKK